MKSQDLTNRTDHSLLPALTGMTMTRVGLILPDDLPMEAWEQLAENFKHADSAFKWALADWIVHGEQHKYGKKYKRASELTGFEESFLRNLAMVARKVELSRRRDSLSLSHHQEVAALSTDLQDKWLARADADKMTVKSLRQAIQSAAVTRSSPVPTLPHAMPDDQAQGAANGQAFAVLADDADADARVSLEVSYATYQKIEALAQSRKKTLEEWIDYVIERLYGAMMSGRKVPDTPIEEATTESVEQ